MLVFLKFMVAGTIALECEPTDYIQSIKEYIWANFDIHAISISLVFNGKDLSDLLRLRDIGIVGQNSMILVIIKRELLGEEEYNEDEIRRKVKEHGHKVHNKIDVMCILLDKIVKELMSPNKWLSEFEQESESDGSTEDETNESIIIDRKELDKIDSYKKQLEINKAFMKTKREMHSQIKKQKKKEWKMVKSNNYKQKVRCHQKCYR